ncbi:MAG: nprA [Bacteroidetes bacterium]|nr:nprA [Bacteroidota bacterium]
MSEDSVAGTNEIKKAFYALNSISDKAFNFRSIDKIGRVYNAQGFFHKARFYWMIGIKKAKDQNDKEWQAKFYQRIAIYLQGEDYIKQSLLYFDSALAVARTGEPKLLASILMNKGRAHYDMGDYKPAMDNYIEAQRLFEKHKWWNVDYGHLLHFIGSVFKQQDFYEKALDYYQKELTLAKEIKNKNLEGEGYYLCASMYGTMGNLDKELEYLQEAIKIYEGENNLRMLGLMYGNLSANYSDRKNYQKAIEYNEKALKIYEETGETQNLSAIYRNLGELARKGGDLKKAMSYLKQAMTTAQKIETKRMLNTSEIKEAMAYVYSDMGDYHKAFDLIQEYRSIHDSLTNASNVEYLHTLEKQYETEKKEKEIALLNADKKANDEARLKEQAQGRLIIMAAILGFIIAGVSIVAFINKRKTSKLLSTQVNEINYQNSVIKEKNKDITDSIQYAKRLQEAVFPEVDVLNTYFSESFVLFRPKDIVSGDFYWFEKIEHKTILIVGDCTGHGVPGAFMSILGHNLLNQIILEEEITDPAEVLRLLDKRVSNALNKKGSKKEYNDGMDIAICVIDQKENKISFAGANRPLIINRGEELIEIKPNKFGIGGIEDDRCKLFGKQEITLKENDILYLFSDGYYDQFGGPKGKKFKYKQLIDCITSISSKPLMEQGLILDTTLEKWRGNLEQIDDICVIGVKV